MDMEPSRYFPIKSPPSLQHIMCVYIAQRNIDFNKIRNICQNHYEIQNRYLSTPRSAMVRELTENNIRDLKSDALQRLSAYCLTDELTDQVMDHLLPLYNQVFKFININEPLMSTTIDLKVCFVLNMDGSINRYKTHKKIIMNADISNKVKFASACALCSEEDILNILENAAEDEKLYDDYFNPPLVKVWRDILLRGHVKWPSSRFFFEKIASHCEGAYYIIEKLPPDLRSSKINECFHNAVKYNTDIDFWLERMSSEQKKAVIRTQSYLILVNYLEWPRVSHVVEAAKLVWAFLGTKKICDFLWLVYKKISARDIKAEFDYEPIFFKLWLECPNELKEGPLRVRYELEAIYDKVTQTVRSHDSLKKFDKKRKLNMQNK
ncbi:hypothetical protein HNY73_010468 [Argiope bruennichi]|uniref:Uncharacterized protein n=1 Tax=Argiope bruennichi TaxID=94029 RepID=A0A8T0F328_ARGBR|nr:hypothetical protein HNY73_010468 [Argiope bruennichi]